MTDGRAPRANADWLLVLVGLSALIGLVSAVEAADAVPITGSTALLLSAAVLVLPTLQARRNMPFALRLSFPATVLAAVCALAHAGLVWRDDYDADFLLLAATAAGEPGLLTGIAALALLLPLGLTANRNAVRLLGRERWHDLQRSLWIAAGLAVAHALSDGESAAGLALTIACAATLVAIAVARLRALRPLVGRRAPSPATRPQAVRFFDQRPK